MNYQVKDIKTHSEIEDVKKLLSIHQLNYEELVTYTLGIYHQDQLIATGSLFHHIIKMIAVDPSYQGENITAMLLTHLIFKLGEQKIYKYFLFTSLKQAHYFEPFNFSLVEKTSDIVLFENHGYTIKERLNDIKNTLPHYQNCAAIIMNCNPVTLGHLHLIDTASQNEEMVLIFLVEEDASLFSFQVRMDLLNKATKHLKNVFVIPSTPYIISKATFPTYFLKEDSIISKAFMDLDIQIFKTYFIEIFNIKKRYVGQEPFDLMTQGYNQKMKDILKNQLHEIKRLSIDDHIISASFVRKLMYEKKYEDIKKYVPKTTYQFLMSKKGKTLFESSKNS